MNKVFLTLQSCMKETLKCDGDNTFKIPHMGKDKLFRGRKTSVDTHIGVVQEV
jgi:hypothetical protein